MTKPTNIFINFKRFCTYEKTPTKIYLKLGILLFGIPIFIIACQKDDNVIIEEANSQLEFKRNVITKSEVAKNQKVNSIIQTLPKANDIASNNSNLQGRSVYIEEYDFYVDDEIAYYITYGNYDSYTFAIHRSQDNGLVENLMLSKQDDGSYKATIVSYNLTEAEKQTVKNGIMPSGIENKTSIQPLPQVINSTDSSIILIGSTGIYYDTGSDSCKRPIIDLSGEFVQIAGWEPVNCPQGYLDIISANNDGNTGGGNNDDDNLFNPNDDPTGSPNQTDPNDGNSNSDNPFGDLLSGGNGSGDGTGNPNQTDPDDPDQDETQDCLEVNFEGNCIGDVTSPLISNTDDCKKLKEDITDIPLVKTRLHTMKVSSASGEKGLRIQKHHDTGQYIPTPIMDNNNGMAHIKIPVNLYTTVIAHTHPPSEEEYFAMFSGPDIIKMGEIVKFVKSSEASTVDVKDITHILIADGRTFALKFDNEESAEELLNIYNDRKKRKRFNKTLHNYYKRDRDHITYQSTTTIAKQQRHLFNLLSKYNLNVSLYEANYNSSGFIDDWQKINKESLEKEPCN